MIILVSLFFEISEVSKPVTVLFLLTTGLGGREFVSHLLVIVCSVRKIRKSIILHLSRYLFGFCTALLDSFRHFQHIDAKFLANQVNGWCWFIFDRPKVHVNLWLLLIERIYRGLPEQIDRRLLFLLKGAKITEIIILFIVRRSLAEILVRCRERVLARLIRKIAEPAIIITRFLKVPKHIVLLLLLRLVA